MTAASSDPDAPIVFCSNWTDTVQWVEQFPAPEIAIDYEGDVTGTAWVFRGLKDSRYQLLPTIEREAECTGMPWSALEVLVSSEFKSRAHMHLSNLIAGDEFTWLAQMQHYAIPTRLLDFTHSPFVALYFAIRESRQEKDRASVRVWAIDAGAINSRFRLIASKARSAQREYDGKPTSHRVRLDLDSFATARDSMVDETHGMRTLIAESLAASQAFRGVLNRSGGVCVASPPAFNPRLAGQQGVFLLNCAENLSFSDSLVNMMGSAVGWCQIADIDVKAIPELEQKLFQRNIHEQSLFPDMEGLAGLIRQKTRLHWK